MTFLPITQMMSGSDGDESQAEWNVSLVMAR